MTQSARCVIDDCQVRQHGRGLCSKRYHQVYRWETLQVVADHEFSYDAVATAAHYRNALHMAHAKVVQALLIHDFPETPFPTTIPALLHEIELVIRRVCALREPGYDEMTVDLVGQRGPNDVY